MNAFHTFFIPDKRPELSQPMLDRTLRTAGQRSVSQNDPSARGVPPTPDKWAKRVSADWWGRAATKQGGKGSFDLAAEFVANGTGRNPGTKNATANLAFGASLRQAIYTGDGPYTWGGAVHRVSDNDVYAAIYLDLIAGYAWGYFGGRYGNDSARYTGKPPFEAARKAQTRYAAFNPYAAVIYKNSNSYGFSFSDTGPKKVQIGLNGVSTLRITIPKDKAASQPRRCRA